MLLTVRFSCPAVNPTAAPSQTLHQHPDGRPGLFAFVHGRNIRGSLFAGKLAVRGGRI